MIVTCLIAWGTFLVGFGAGLWWCGRALRDALNAAAVAQDSCQVREDQVRALLCRVGTLKAKVTGLVRLNNALLQRCNELWARAATAEAKLTEYEHADGHPVRPS